MSTPQQLVMPPSMRTRPLGRIAGTFFPGNTPPVNAQEPFASLVEPESNALVTGTRQPMIEPAR